MALRLTLRQLEYFVAVGEAGSITIASERVNVSSPSMSAAISQLENEFGIQLFVRHHAQGLALTPGGRQFLIQAKASWIMRKPFMSSPATSPASRVGPSASDVW